MWKYVATFMQNINEFKLFNIIIIFYLFIFIYYSFWKSCKVLKIIKSGELSKNKTKLMFL